MFTNSSHHDFRATDIRISPASLRSRNGNVRGSGQRSRTGSGCAQGGARHGSEQRHRPQITERLASQGFFVYAGARAQKDLDELNGIRNVQAVRLDVTVASDIA